MERHRDRDRYIYPHHASFNLLYKSSGGSTVPGENRGAVSVFVPVHKLDGFAGIVDAYDTKDRAKNLLTINPHARPDVVEKTTSDEKGLLNARQR